jgi:hypothetical protein
MRAPGRGKTIPKARLLRSARNDIAVTMRAVIARSENDETIWYFRNDILWTARN